MVVVLVVGVGVAEAVGGHETEKQKPPDGKDRELYMLMSIVGAQSILPVIHNEHRNNPKHWISAFIRTRSHARARTKR